MDALGIELSVEDMTVAGHKQSAAYNEQTSAQHQIADSGLKTIASDLNGGAISRLINRGPGSRQPA